MNYKIWWFISLVISGITAWVVNPVTFGLVPTKNITLNIFIRAAVFVIVYLILIRIGKPSKKPK